MHHNKRRKMVDTLKTVGVGAGGFGVQFMSMLPEMVKVAVGIMTALYMAVKVYKELRK
tara:strand:+ start:404 stop:577 length:174 start_codon:yes stop_codon:yes gene_type:complete